jgi:hypothetical protein
MGRSRPKSRRRPPVLIAEAVLPPALRTLRIGSLLRRLDREDDAAVDHLASGTDGPAERQLWVHRGAPVSERVQFYEVGSHLEVALESGEFLILCRCVVASVHQRHPHLGEVAHHRDEFGGLTMAKFKPGQRAATRAGGPKRSGR